LKLKSRSLTENQKMLRKRNVDQRKFRNNFRLDLPATLHGRFAWVMN
jgi:hypothetical protein